MLALFGIIVVFAAVLGGFLMEHGNPWVLVQPAEFLIICGAAAGIILVSNPWAVIRKMVRGTVSTFLPPRHDSRSYLLSLRMLYETFVFSQRNGGPAVLETHIEEPEKSSIFKNHPWFLKDLATRTFV